MSIQFFPSYAQEDEYTYLPIIACSTCTDSATETPEPPAVASPTVTPTQTSESTVVASPTATPTQTLEPTAVASATATSTQTPLPTNTATSTPTPTAEGFIYFASGNDIKDLYKMRFDSTDKQQLTRYAETLAEHDENYYRTISHSPTRDELVIATKSELFLIDTEGNFIQTLISFETERLEAANQPIAWSPTGDQLAFIARRCAEGTTSFPCTSFSEGGLYIVDRNGDNLEPLFNMSTISNSSKAIWGANDEHIWINSARLITKVSVPDGNSSDYTDAIYEDHPNSFDISSSEEKAAWTNGYSDLYTFDLNVDSPDATQRHLTWDYFNQFEYIQNTGPYYTNVVWSPTSDRIAFTGVIDNTTLGPAMPIYISDADGSNFRKLTERPNERREFLVMWLDNGKILFNSEHDGGFRLADVMLVNEDGSNEENLTDSPEVDDIALFVTP